MEELQLSHYGVKGMQWGVRKKPSAATLVSRNASLSKKIAWSDTTKANAQKKIAKNQNKLNRYQVKSMQYYMTSRDIQGARRSARRIRKYTRETARLTKNTARYKKAIDKNTKMLNMLNSPLSDITSKDVTIGKNIVDLALERGQ